MTPLYKRSDSKYYWVRIEHKGKVIQESTRETLKRKAELVEAELRLQHFPELEGGREIPTLAEFTRELLPYWTRELKPATRGYYTDALKHVLAYEPIANARLSDIRPRLLEAFKSKRMNEGAGLCTVQHSLRALRRALAIAVNTFEYRFQPPKFQLRAEPKRDFVLSEADFQRLIANCGRAADEPIAPGIVARAGSGREVMQCLFTVLYDCGLRASEVCRLEWADINLDEKWLFVRFGKTKAARRRVPLTARVVAALAGLKAKRRDGVEAVFTRYHGKQSIRRGWASTEFKRIAGLLGLRKGAVLHSLRHSCASRLGNAGAQTADLMAFMGWESPLIAKTYTHLNEDRMTQLSGFLEPKQSQESIR